MTLSTWGCLHYRQVELARFTEWKMMGGTYVLGMEPANCGVAAGPWSEPRDASVLDPGRPAFSLQIGWSKAMPPLIVHFQ
jgi:hypothetical protein